MYGSCDSEFMEGQAYPGMPDGINTDFDAWRREWHRSSGKEWARKMRRGSESGYAYGQE